MGPPADAIERRFFDVSRVLGHAQISTTADIHGQLVPDMAASAATRMDTLLKVGTES